MCESEHLLLAELLRDIPPSCRHTVDQIISVVTDISYKNGYDDGFEVGVRADDIFYTDKVREYE